MGHAGRIKQRVPGYVSVQIQETQWVKIVFGFRRPSRNQVKIVFRFVETQREPG